MYYLKDSTIKYHHVGSLQNYDRWKFSDSLQAHASRFYSLVAIYLTCISIICLKSIYDQASLLVRKLASFIGSRWEK